MNWTWLGLAVLVLLAFSMVDGYRHGFVKEVVSALLVLISVALVWLINPCGCRGVGIIGYSSG